MEVFLEYYIKQGICNGDKWEQIVMLCQQCIDSWKTLGYWLQIKFHFIFRKYTGKVWREHEFKLNTMLDNVILK